MANLPTVVFSPAMSRMETSMSAAEMDVRSLTGIGAEKSIAN